LNPDQEEAVSRVLQMRDYALVLGMPGTGKTSTIVSIIRVSESWLGKQHSAFIAQRYS
jgi:superfamily II DNA or RNA helicase